MRADPDDAGLLSAAQTSLLIDRYELAMAASYHRRGMNDPAVFELFVRELRPDSQIGCSPPASARRSRWCARCGSATRSSPTSRHSGSSTAFLEYLAGFRFSGDVDAIPEGSVVFAGEPLVRVTAPRIEGQLLETLLLNQLNFQTAVATKAARIVLSIGAGLPDPDGRLIDFSPRRDHGVDAAMKAARSAAIAGAGGTSNVAAAMRYGLQRRGHHGPLLRDVVRARAGGVPRLHGGRARRRGDAGGHIRHARGRPARDRRGAGVRSRARRACGSTRATCCPRPARLARCSTRRESPTR